MFRAPKIKPTVKQTVQQPEAPPQQTLQPRDVYRMILKNKNKGAKNASR